VKRAILEAAALITGLCACGQRVAVLQGIPVSETAVDVGEERAVMKAEHAWVQAAIAGDADAFGRFMADEYVAQGPKGALLMKATWVQRVREGTSKFQAVNFCNMKARIHGDAAVLTADYAQIATKDGKDNSGKGSEIDFWVKRDGRWLVVASAFGASSPQCST
jgi:ketosteroid isomerase-like protein